MVADAAEARLRRDGFPSGIISDGFQALYGLSAENICLAARACALLHDLGKLQDRWQAWARAWQLSRDSSYNFTLPLAHTDFEPDSPNDRHRQQSLGVRRPSHAAASAYYASALLDSALEGIPDHVQAEVASACAAAIIAHHGAFIPRTPNNDLGIFSLSKGWEQTVANGVGCTARPEITRHLQRETDKKGYLTEFLEIAVRRDALEKWWPLVSYLTRTLRLSDQRATSEWACSE